MSAVSVAAFLHDSPWCPNLSTLVTHMQVCSVQIVAPNRSPTAILSAESSRRFPTDDTGKADSQTADPVLEEANKRARVMTSAFSRRVSDF